MDRRHHVGYYLISRGRFALEADVGYPPTVRDRLARFVFQHPVFGYLGIIAIVIAASRGQPAVVRDPPRRDGYAAGLRSDRWRCCR